MTATERSIDEQISGIEPVFSSNFVKKNTKGKINMVNPITFYKIHLETNSHFLESMESRKKRQAESRYCTSKMEGY